MFCKKCGNKIDDDAMFCENCGTAVKRIAHLEVEPMVEEEAANSSTISGIPVESAEEQHPKKTPFVKWIAVAAVAIVAIIAVLFLLSGSKSNGDNFYHEINYNNKGCFAYDDERLYFIALYDEDDDDTSVYSTDYKGVNKKLISRNADIIRIRVVDGKIYYVESSDDEYRIGVMDTDGKNPTVLISLEESVAKFAVQGKKLYYLSDSQLYVCDIDGTNCELLLDEVTTFVLGSKMLYYVDENDVISAFNLKKRTATEICKSSDVSDLALNENILYFRCDSGLSCVDVKAGGTVTRVVSDSQLCVYAFFGDYIYYNQLFEEDEAKALAEYLAEDDIDYVMYKITFLLSGKLYRANKDGSGICEVEDADPSLIYMLYTYPDGMYSIVTVFNDTLDLIEFE